MKKMTFDEAMQHLSDLVGKLESGSLSLEDSLSCFEEAVRYIRLCNEKLAAARQKVAVLTENADGVTEEKPFFSDET